MIKKVSVVTGGAGGIGQAIAGEIGKKSSVVLVGRSEKGLKRAQGELASMGMEVFVYAADVSKRADTDALAEYASGLGEIAYVINAAGVDPSNAFTGSKIMAVNAGGTINMAQSFYPVIAEGGLFVAFASLVAHHGPGNIDELLAGWGENPEIYRMWNEPDFCSMMCEEVRKTVGGGTDEEIAGPCYAASKKFVVQFVRMNVDRFAARGARILSVSPGLTITPMHLGFCRDEPEIALEELRTIPLGRKAQPYELGALIDFLTSPGSEFLNGTDVLIDGGQVSNTKVPQIS